MTKDLHPELGSGALREALQKWQRKYFSAGISHEMWPKAVEHGFEAGWQAALSLSSPIEPRCKVTGNPCGTDTWAVGYPCKCENCQAWLAQQASSEIREAALKEAINVLPSKPSEHDSAQFREGYYAGLEAYRQAIRAALAPSRQGAAKRVEG